MAIVYKHVRLDKNEPFYVGIGKTKKRAHNKTNRSKSWKSIAKKGYEVIILWEDLTWKQACEEEKKLITFYGRRDLNLGTLVNMTDGGDGRVSSKPSKETLRKMSTSRKGRKHSTEVKNRISEVSKGKPGTNKGRSFSQEWKDNISKAKMGYKHKTEAKEKMVSLHTTAVCPYCSKIGQETAMKRWHFSNCKKKTNE